MSTVPQAAVEATMQVMGCIVLPERDDLDSARCDKHLAPLNERRECVLAATVAAAVVAAVQVPIKAEARHELITAVYRSGRDLVHIDDLQEFSNGIEVTHT